MIKFYIKCEKWKNISNKYESDFHNNLKIFFFNVTLFIFYVLIIGFSLAGTLAALPFHFLFIRT